MAEKQSLADKKSSLIRKYSETRSLVLASARGFTKENQEVAFVGSWGILDILAHLIGWDLANLRAAEDILAGKVPDFYAEFDQDWASFNKKLVASHKQHDLERMIGAVDQSRAAVAEYLEGLDPEDLFRDHGVREKGYKVTISRLIEADTKDVLEHLAQIRQFLDQAPASGDRTQPPAPVG